MIKTLTPIIAIVIAIALFFVYVQPTFTSVRVIEDETHQYEEAIASAERLQARVSELSQAQNTIPVSDLQRLEAMVPNSLDEVLLLIDLSALAQEHNLFLGEIQVDAEGAEGEDPFAEAQPAPQNGAVEGEAYESMDLGFSVVGTYEDFRAFVRAVEESLVLMEVVEISFSQSDGDLLTFDMVIRTYALNN